ncbi:MAG TPA: trehalose-6-phosphate synthase [Candidatus Polarisedimenticolia bacterium]|nr:trehalose-6-phosphate synthase [Candidatus Polarisedimenticolia bacterium]
MRRALTRMANRQALGGELAEQTSPEDLASAARSYLGDTPIVIASNREPYQHVHTPGGIEVIRSAGGLASALDSVARATGATWVAQGAADADRLVTDSLGRVRVPPGDERYTLQRVWLEPEVQAVEYRRFCNGCLWPLCHIVYVRPHFVASRWRVYQEVNEQFAEAILASLGPRPGLVLLQDYQLGLCASALRARRPDLSIVMFWHIPWPNREVYRTFPWRRELLEGLLACDLVGFHIQYHAMNFLDTVAQEMEAHIDHERSAVRRRGRKTYVRNYPISPDAAEISLAASEPWSTRAAAEVRASLQLQGRTVVLGVDRLDYTKGIPERLSAYEHLLETRPELRDKVSFVQIGVPSRVDLPEYQALTEEVEAHAARLNQRFGRPGLPAVHLILRNLGFRDLIPYYVLADVAVVSALHDGMNLVAKEYVAAKVNLDGALVLSPFTGAARELDQAIQASPYDAEALAAAIGRALTLSPEERARRMKAMREVVASQNIYDWAIKILRDARRLHLVPGSTRPGAAR